MVFLITLLNILIPLGMRLFIGEISGQNNFLSVVSGLVVFTICMLLNTFFEIKWMILLDEFGGKCITDITLTVEDALAKTSQSNIDEVQPEIIKHVMYADILDVFRVVGHHIPSLVGTCLTIIFSFLIAAIYNLKLAIFITIGTLTGMFLALAGRKMIAKKAGKTNQKLKTHHGLCNQFVESLIIVQTNPILNYFQEKTSNSIQDFIKTSQKEDWTTVFWMRIVENYNLLLSIGLSALLVFPASEGSVVDLVFFTMMSALLSSEGQKAELLLQQIVKAEISFQNIDRLIHFPRRHGCDRLEHIDTLSFQDVSFAYGKSMENILQQITCSFHSGELIQIVGGNGSGKSTFIKLITGIYQPKTGHILCNGKDLSSYKQDEFNQKVLYIGQDEKFLNESVKNYLEIISNHSLSDLEWRRLIQDFTGIDEKHQIENCGLTLSVGQRKKLLILKLFLRVEEASVIILDEVQAGLDKESKKEFTHYIERLAQNKNKIIFMIEHDADSELNYDQTITF